jgi:hypothetical protein
LEGIKDRISPTLKDTNFPGLIDNETTSSRKEETYNTSETDNLRTKLQEKTEMIEDLKKKLEESHEALDELKEVSQLNKELWAKDLSILREDINKLQNNETERISQIELNRNKVRD